MAPCIPPSRSWPNWPTPSVCRCVKCFKQPGIRSRPWPDTALMAVVAVVLPAFFLGLVLMLDRYEERLLPTRSSRRGRHARR
ncbi:hypothetical protein GCM10010346_63330 [Streptomyces chryseus]|uniref:Uncharacterized protein n=1 Tax=Streptomyces chryseus TaxID=68186 RepID=A0ABQ3E9W1_9ACTN|nr:hypothetical protein GCM10010346_63330 [Streptomyces chryseus]